MSSSPLMASFDYDSGDSLQWPMIERAMRETSMHDALEKLEGAFTAYTGASAAVAFSSPAVAVEGLIYVEKIGARDRSLLPAWGPAYLAQAFMDHRVPLVLLDAIAASHHLDFAPLAAQERMPSRRQILVVGHVDGIAPDLQGAFYALKGWDDLLVEEASQSLGSSYPTGERVGSCRWSHYTLFDLSCKFGFQAGAVVMCQSRAAAQKLRQWRDQHFTQSPCEAHYPHLSHSFSPPAARMSSLMATIAKQQLTTIDVMRSHHTALIRRYREELDPSLEVVLADNTVATCYSAAWLLIDFELFQTTAAKVVEHLRRQQVAAYLFPIPLYAYAQVRDYPYLQLLCETPQWPGHEEWRARTILLPLSSKLSLDRMKSYADHLHQALAGR